MSETTTTTAPVLCAGCSEVATFGTTPETAMCSRHASLRWAVQAAENYRRTAYETWDMDERSRLLELSAEYEAEADDLAAGGLGNHAWLNIGMPKGATPGGLVARVASLLFRRT